MTMSPGAGFRHSTIPDIAKAMLPRCTGMCAAWADSRPFASNTVWLGLRGRFAVTRYRGHDASRFFVT